MLRPEKTQKLTTRFERSDRAEVRLLVKGHQSIMRPLQELKNWCYVEQSREF